MREESLRLCSCHMRRLTRYSISGKTKGVQKEPAGGGDTRGMRCRTSPETAAVLEAAGSCCCADDLGFLPKIP
ncbi:hypothetical protein GOBAR_AA37772 [Gossypium barbadense]|uniref:Uncharacterized protein n=1 Tax=Gossypium barbadense TaxID=3634 RepID=A0A2P5VVR5_GOSBA|nr:hypothetical protein GOBAR_AA37772 [Gossypium barbadense]